MRFYNTLTHSLEAYQPLTPPVVRIYTCGLTVYDFGHIGNFRAFLFADVLRRLLEVRGLEVMHVMNITDVGHMTEDDVADGAGEDKMAVGSKRLKEAKKAGVAHARSVQNPDDPYEVAKFYTQAFLEDAKKLGLKVASEYPNRMPAATDNVDEMLRLIAKLVDKNHAYNRRRRARSTSASRASPTMECSAATASTICAAGRADASMPHSNRPSDIPPTFFYGSPMPGTSCVGRASSARGTPAGTSNARRWR